MMNILMVVNTYPRGRAKTQDLDSQGGCVDDSNSVNDHNAARIVDDNYDDDDGEDDGDGGAADDDGDGDVDEND